MNLNKNASAARANLLNIIYLFLSATKVEDLTDHEEVIHFQDNSKMLVNVHPWENEWGVAELHLVRRE